MFENYNWEYRNLKKNVYQCLLIYFFINVGTKIASKINESKQKLNNINSNSSLPVETHEIIEHIGSLKTN